MLSKEVASAVAAVWLPVPAGVGSADTVADGVGLGPPAVEGPWAVVGVVGAVRLGAVTLQAGAEPRVSLATTNPEKLPPGKRKSKNCWEELPPRLILDWHHSNKMAST